jgi:predicted nucleic acid-binding protein
LSAPVAVPTGLCAAGEGHDHHGEPARQPSDLQQSREYFRRADLHKLSAVDATSFAIMKRTRIRLAYAFDHHFAVVGFRLVT